MLRENVYFSPLSLDLSSLTLFTVGWRLFLPSDFIYLFTLRVFFFFFFLWKRIRFYSIEKRRTILLIQRKQLHHITIYK